MALTPDEIKSIEQVTTSLKRWADNLSYEYSPTLIRIGPRLGQDKVVLWLLREMPAVGQKVEKDFNVLDEIIGEINSWCSKTITEDELVEFDNLVDILKGGAYDVTETLQEIVQKASQELSTEKPAGTGQKEIVEVKPGAFGITVNIKEIAKRIWKCVCSRSKD